jgi:hypothetical protein
MGQPLYQIPAALGTRIIKRTDLGNTPFRRDPIPPHISPIPHFQAKSFLPPLRWDDGDFFGNENFAVTQNAACGD